MAFSRSNLVMLTDKILLDLVQSLSSYRATFVFIKKGDPKEFRVMKQKRNGLENITSSPSNTTKKIWFAEFSLGRTSTDDALRSGRQNEAVNEQTVKEVIRIVLKDRKIKLSEIAVIVHISKERIGHILREHLSMKKLSARSVPRLLTIDQKQQRVDDSEHDLVLLKRNPWDFFSSICDF